MPLISVIDEAENSEEEIPSLSELLAEARSTGGMHTTAGVVANTLVAEHSPKPAPLRGGTAPIDELVARELVRWYCKVGDGVELLYRMLVQRGSASLERQIIIVLLEWICETARPRVEVFGTGIPAIGDEDGEGDTTETAGPLKGKEAEEGRKAYREFVAGCLHLLEWLLAREDISFLAIPTTSTHSNDSNGSSEVLGKITTLLATFTILPQRTVTYSTDTTPSWTTPSLTQLAHHILTAHQSLLATPLVLKTILSTIIKPLFSASNPPPGSKSSATFERKANSDLVKNIYSDHDAFPWVYDRIEAVTVLGWIIPQLTITSDITTQEFLPIVLPPILTLLDSPHAVPHRRDGCKFICLLLVPKSGGGPFLGQKELEKRGLGRLLWNEVFPCVNFLPPLTPQKQAVPLLYEALSALIEIARGWYLGIGGYGGGGGDGSGAGSGGEGIINRRELTKRRSEMCKDLLTPLMRKGLIHAVDMTGSGEHLGVVEVVLDTLLSPPLSSSTPISSTSPNLHSQVTSTGLLPIMGLYALPHLHQLVPFLATGVLGNPFMLISHNAAAIRCVRKAVRVLQYLLTGQMWVRMDRWWTTILEGCVACWNRVWDEIEGMRGVGSGGGSEDGDSGMEEQGMRELAGEVRVAVNVLAALVCRCWPQECGIMVKSEGSDETEREKDDNLLAEPEEERKKRAVRRREFMEAVDRIIAMESSSCDGGVAIGGVCVGRMATLFVGVPGGPAGEEALERGYVWNVDCP